MILALDVGTSSARAALYDESGVPVPRRLHRVAYEPTITADGGVEHDPNVVLAAVATCLDAVLTGPGLPDVAGVGVATFWHGLLGFDATGHAVTPIYMWADTRSAREATLLAGALDEAGLHARTGCYIHTSYWPAKLRWLARERPAELQRVTRWGSIGEHLEHAFFGEAATSVSIASATGLFDHARLHWDRRRWPPPGSRRPSCFRSWIVTSRGEICGPRGPVAGRHCAACPGSRPSAMARRATPAPSASIRRVSRSTWARRQ